jgi:hypothetical protein
MAMTIWGSNASGGTYAAIAALTNIPATIFAALIYELFLGSATRSRYSLFTYHTVLTACRAAALTSHHIHFLRAHKQYYEDNKLAPYGYLEGLNPQRGQSESFESDLGEKRRESRIETVEAFGGRV